MGKVLRAMLGAMAGAILGAILGFVVLVGNATPFIRSPVEVFAIACAVGGALLGLRGPRGVGRVSLGVVLLAVIGCAVVAFVLAQLLWHDLQSGMVHP